MNNVNTELYNSHDEGNKTIKRRTDRQIGSNQAWELQSNRNRSCTLTCKPSVSIITVTLYTNV